MEKEQNQKTENNTQIKNKDDEVIDEASNEKPDNNLDAKKEEAEIKPEGKIRELEDKLARTFAEMENQRRRFEKEREEREMMEIDDDQKEPGTVVQEIQKGFTIKDRLLRPSLVGVSKKTEKKDPNTEENKENFESK